MARFRLRSPQIKLSENDVEKQCLDILRLRGLYPVRLQVGKFKTPDDRWITIGEPGLPDYCIPKFFVETKAPRGALREAQERKIHELEEIWRVPVVVAHDLDALLAWLDKNLPR